MMRLVSCFIAIVALFVGCPGCLQGASPVSREDVESAFQDFFAAASPAEAELRIDAILKTGVSFDDALARLRIGRPYAPQKAGVILLHNKTADGVEHNFAIDVPAGYDPARKYQVRFQLHGGIDDRTDNSPRGSGSIGGLAGAEQIYITPYAWDRAPWWSSDQLLNLDEILYSVKRTYNIDENRVVLSGVSDGATGAYFVAMSDTTPFASFLPLNGFILVLSIHPEVEGSLFPNNLLNKPLFVVNGGKDPIYPGSTVEPYTRHLMSAGVQIDNQPQPEGQHNTRWWPEVKDTFENFVADHPRDPHPAQLTWEAAAGTGNRAHWLIIDAFGDVAGQATKLPDVNSMRGLNSEGVMFLRPRPTGRVDLRRTGNTVEAVTKGASAFTLLVSGDRFDMKQPVRIIANGREVFNSRVTPNLQTLLKWAARDNDRTMLYAAEIPIVLH